MSRIVKVIKKSLRREKFDFKKVWNLSCFSTLKMSETKSNQTFNEVLEEFGLLKVSKSRSRKTKHPQMHNYKYLLVIDFEATCWDPAERKKLKQEIIEFPACLVNLHTGIIEDEFRSYCKPTEMPTLSEYCKELTGIQQEWVDSGMLLEDCIQSFTRWLKIQIKVRNLVLPKTKRSNPDGNCLLVSWSNWDFMICLNRECSRKKIRYEILIDI